jgi:multicomponent Na+:H+ antiporter subunit D
MNYIPILLIFIPIIFSVIIFMFHNKLVNYLAFLCQLVLSTIVISYHRELKVLGTHSITVGGWSRTAGITLKNDWLSISTLFLAVFLITVIIIYSWGKKETNSSFLFFLLFLEGVFLGLLQTNDLFNLFIFFEIITIASSILIVFKKDANSLKIVLYYLLFNSAGMLFYLLGVVILYMVTGTLNMELATIRLAELGNPTSVKIAYIFIMSALAVKSAFFPVHNWLPKAHGAAPAAVSALLSGLLVKAGLYSFIRINQVFGGILFQEFFFALGFITALVGVIFALTQKDMKQILAYHTVSQVGIMLIGISHMTGSTFYGGLLHLFNHAMFKSLLFMGAGVIIAEYGTRNVYEIKGVFKRLPLTSILMIVGMLSITGAPFFNGYISKGIVTYSLSPLQSVLFNIINLGTSISFIKMAQIFMGIPTSSAPFEKTNTTSSNIAMFMLAAMCLVLGIFYAPLAVELWNVELKAISLLDLQKWLKYIITMSFGILVYIKIIKKDYFIIKKIRDTDISFEAANVLMIMFVFTMMILTVII